MSKAQCLASFFRRGKSGWPSVSHLPRRVSRLSNALSVVIVSIASAVGNLVGLLSQRDLLRETAVERLLRFTAGAGW